MAVIWHKALLIEDSEHKALCIVEECELIVGLLGMLTLQLQDDNFAKWSFQFRSVLEGYDLFVYFYGTNVYPPKYVISLDNGVTKEITDAYRQWIKIDMALLSLPIVTLGDEAIEYVVGSKTTYEAWTHLCDQYATVSRARINHLKTELHTIKKGTDSIEKYILRLKHPKDQLLAAGESIYENDLIVAALAGLPAEYNMIRTVIVAALAGENISENDLIIAELAGLPAEYNMIRTIIVTRESPITLKEFHEQLLSAKKIFYQGGSSTQNDSNFNRSAGFVGQYKKPPGNMVVINLRMVHLVEVHLGILVLIGMGANPPSSFTATDASAYSEFNAIQAWIMNTCATHHMTGDMVNLNMVTPFEGDQKITVGNGKCLLVKNTVQSILEHFYAINLKYFQSDGGGEYMIKKFKNFLASNGILSYHHQGHLLLGIGKIVLVLVLQYKHLHNILFIPLQIPILCCLPTVLHTLEGYTAVLSIQDSIEITTFRSAIIHDHWRNAMVEEFNALQKQGTWELVPPPTDRNIIGSNWVYKTGQDEMEVPCYVWYAQDGMRRLFRSAFGVGQHSSIRSSNGHIGSGCVKLGEVFDMQDMDPLTFFSGLQITYKENEDLFISQSKYVKDLLKKTFMDSSKPCSTPCKPHTQLLKDERTPLVDPTLFRSLVEALQYLTFTRPDIDYAINYACQFMVTPTYTHFCLVKRI
ncbi:uncharacterized protein [Malus domestica]|uniref:uncharacterized protein n=1 Tax=Malus domestica TaxID=3750 RepID=UPI003977090D